MSEQSVTVDRIRCDGFGTCAQLLPERITLDEWGYPVIDPRPVHRTELQHAKRAVNACPRLALSLVKAPQGASR
ncbi:MAG TPA: ferredoxin [Candidatus Nanopelagicales bacterium]|nr:ferredoxin [Candidatus Nanopelagicales bacterium]